MQDKTILSALLNIRAKIIRDELDGIDHVDSLLTARGYDISLHVVPKKIPRYFKGRGKQRQFILSALREGPCTSPEIAARIARMRPGTDADAILGSVSVGLTMMKKAGVVAHEGVVWMAVKRVGR